MNNLHNLSLSAIAQQLRSGALSAQQVMEYCGANYERTEEALNAYKTWDGARALEVAKAVDSLLKNHYDLGALMGIPVSIKDLFGVPGLPTFAGSSAALAAEFSQAGRLVQAFIDQLSPITGKSHTVEFAFGGIGMNGHWGTPRNPWDTKVHRIPGGSSSGAGVSLLQGSALLALGTDTAGSVRIPASFTGTTALKTTEGRWPKDHTVPLSSTLDTPGLLARTIEDLIFAFEAIESNLQNRPVRVPVVHGLTGVRIGVPENFFWEGVEDSIAAAIEQAIKKLEKAGAIMVPITIPNCDEAYAAFQAGGLGAPELSDFLSRNMPDKIDALDPLVKIRVQGADSLSAIEYLRRIALFRKASQEVNQVFEQVDVWLNPTLITTAAAVADLDDTEQYRQVNMQVLRNPSIANLMHLCAVSLPVGKDAVGIPVGLQLTAAADQEEKLLALSLACEKVLGTGPECLGACPEW